MTRKTFLKLSGNLTAAALAVGSLPAISSCARTSTSAPDPTFGLQLYSLRDAMPGDPRGVLRQVAEFGYKHIESYEGPSGMFWGMTPREFKGYMDDLGTTLIASHCNINENFEQKAAEAGSIGMEYLICPWIGPQPSLDEYKLFADQFNRCGEICNANGIKFAYHNHAYTFEKLDGVYPQDLLMTETDPELVEYELDIFWLVVAGLDPVEWVQKYPGRFSLSHIKDRERGTEVGNGDSSTTLGTGDIDYASIIKIAQSNGMKHLIVEQEKYAGTTPLDSARDNAVFMRNLLAG
jgi:sugar phosphate isomerase/epimerase